MAGKKALKDYEKRRDPGRSGEPRDGGKVEGRHSKPVFVIQEHQARSHHFDFRLEVDGVLKSWAIPKGPSTDPREKRLAIPVEDHPLAYGRFEGVIPEGEYGAGSVIVWDRGPYRNLMGEKEEAWSMAESLKRGHVEVWLEGKKLQGGYALVRTDRKSGSKRQWLLIKMKDEEADARRNPVSTEPESVLSGETVKSIGRKQHKS